MRIQEKVFFKRSYHFFVVLWILVVVMSVDCKLEEQEEPLLAYLIDSGEISRETAGLLQTKCMQEFLLAKRTINYFNPNAQSSTTSMHEAFSILCPQVKKVLLDCLRENILVSEQKDSDSDSDSWYNRYSGWFIFQRHFSSTRRELVQKEESAPFPTVAAVLVIAAFALAIGALLFFFCSNTSGQGINDENPLLRLSLSDHSIASTQKMPSLGALMSEEKYGNKSFNSRLSLNRSSSRSLLTDLHSPTNSKLEIPLGPTNGPLPPPPGNPLRSTSGPLPPPPGIPNPPPERTSSTPPPPSNGSSGPPPPPPPPSAGPRPPPPPPLRGGGHHLLAPPPPRGSGPRPPRGGAPAPKLPPSGMRPPHAPPGPHYDDSESGAAKTKLKPFFWDKVSANPDDSMVWNQIRGGSFQFDEEMIESLFGCAAANKKNEGEKKTPSQDASTQFLHIIDARKSQNLSILLKALNVTSEEVFDALKEGNELPPELIQTLLKMAPTAEEELKLRLFDGDLSRLVPAERFLKVMVELPFAFKRLECLLFMCTLENEAATLKESFAILEAACTEVRKSRLFLKLLEAVLKTGNRMNDGTFRGRAQAFKLDTLLKLSDVRGIDGKTTLLHFVVQEIIRSEGVRAARAAREMRSMSSFKSEDLMDDINHPQESDDYLRSVGLQIVSSLGNELQNVKRAAVLDLDGLTCTVAKMGRALVNVGNFLSSDMKEADEDDGFCEALRCFVQDAEGEVKWLVDEEKRITALMKSTADYFHGNAAGKEEGHRLFLIVRDFLVILDKVCKEVKNMTMVGKEQSPKAAPNQKKAVQVEAGRMMSNGDSQ